MNGEDGDRGVIGHRWVIESTYNSKTFRLTTKGFCKDKDCGEIKRFPNGFKAPNEALINPNDIEHGYRLLVKRGFRG